MSDLPHIRWMIRRELDEVLAIERTVFDFPWSKADFENALRQRNCIGMVAEGPRDRVLGFMVYELYKAHLHLLNIAVCPECRRHGIGRAMLANLKGKLELQRRRQITLEIRERNLPGQLWLKACGFRAVNMLHDFYDDTDESAIVMQWHVRWANQSAAATSVDVASQPS